VNTYQKMPCSPSPATPLEHYQATIFGDICRPSFPVHNIASPEVFVFSATTSGMFPAKLPASDSADRADMTNASFPQAPMPFTSPSKNNADSPCPLSDTNTCSAKKATVEDRKGEDVGNRPATLADGRPKLQAKRLQDCHRRPQQAEAKSDVNHEYRWEKFPDPNDPIPKGYMGTVGSIRMTQELGSESQTCGADGGHVLTCGHWVLSNEACGANCKTEDLAQQPFFCTQCRDIVIDVYNTKVTDAEQARIAFAQTRNDLVYVTLCVEYVTKHLAGVTSNVTQTIINMVTPNPAGRNCLPMSWMQEDDSVEARYAKFCAEKESVEHKKREIRTVMEHGPLNTHEKRKKTTETDLKDGAQVGTHDEVRNGASPSSCSQSFSVTTPSPSNSDSNKRHKTKLQTYPEPITEATRGTKRAYIEEGSQQREGLYTGTSTPCTNVNHSTKKRKRKLEANREPITNKTCDTKRNLPSFDEPIMPTKHFTVSPPPKLGNPAFAVPSTNVVGPLLRKRLPQEQFIDPVEVDLYKRPRMGWPG
jgi:hypothetical protein